MTYHDFFASPSAERNVILRSTLRFHKKGRAEQSSAFFVALEEKRCAQNTTLHEIRTAPPSRGLSRDRFTLACSFK